NVVSVCCASLSFVLLFCFFFQAEDGIRDATVTGVQTCALPICRGGAAALADWKRQVIVIGIFAIGGALGIALMMYLIARQIHAHDELVAVRADKLEAERARLEAERARLETEAKLLKVKRLAVLGEVTGAVAHELHAPLTAIRETLAALKEI